MFGAKTCQVERYKQLRNALNRVCARFAETITEDIFEQAGKKLGMLRKKAMIFDNESEFDVLVDYCLYDVYRGNRNLVERWTDFADELTDADERLILDAMQKAHYSIFKITGLEPGMGARIEDCLYESEELFLYDINISNSALSDIRFGGRILCADDIVMTTGAMLPFFQRSMWLAENVVATMCRRFKAKSLTELTRKQKSEVTAAIIYIALAYGASRLVEFRAPFANETTNEPVGYEYEPEEIRRLHPKDPCICGSKKNFGACCGRNR
ncbi:MAG: hypothetical protein KatS3mg105_1038 [Gemmatales bacterium]|nr:MAG: hypothetical protein KatS3mg105_1038 [Gemmatales bacterium]